MMVQPRSAIISFYQTMNASGLIQLSNLGTRGVLGSKGSTKLILAWGTVTSTNQELHLFFISLTYFVPFLLSVIALSLPLRFSFCHPSSPPPCTTRCRVILRTPIAYSMFPSRTKLTIKIATLIHLLKEREIITRISCFVAARAQLKKKGHQDASLATRGASDSCRQSLVSSRSVSGVHR